MGPRAVEVGVSRALPRGRYSGCGKGSHARCPHAAGVYASWDAAFGRRIPVRPMAAGTWAKLRFRLDDYRAEDPRIGRCSYGLTELHTVRTFNGERFAPCLGAAENLTHYVHL